MELSADTNIRFTDVELCTGPHGRTTASATSHVFRTFRSARHPMEK
jgi:hypothetical protein